jgi:hypothetical protein
MAPFAMIPQWLRNLLVIVFAVLLALATLFFLPDASGPTEELALSKWDTHIDALERQALDDAFKRHIGQLYNVWVTDAYQPRIPPKALIGARNARDAYIRSMEAIEKREQVRPK